MFSGDLKRRVFGLGLNSVQMNRLDLVRCETVRYENLVHGSSVKVHSLNPHPLKVEEGVAGIRKNINDPEGPFISNILELNVFVDMRILLPWND